MAKRGYKIILSESSDVGGGTEPSGVGRIYMFSYANKNKSEHLVKTFLSSEAPTAIKDGRYPPSLL